MSYKTRSDVWRVGAKVGAGNTYSARTTTLIIGNSVTTRKVVRRKVGSEPDTLFSVLRARVVGACASRSPWRVLKSLN